MSVDIIYISILSSLHVQIFLWLAAYIYVGLLQSDNCHAFSPGLICFPIHILIVCYLRHSATRTPNQEGAYTPFAGWLIEHGG
jgi:hypothetical protein